uniref:Reverse transcriptase domain-containing protein n=1 Tax=Pogona vitticeps TaxID=103695 RepID=A0ABM5FF54_9SAUR
MVAASRKVCDAVLSLQHCLGAVQQWMQENGLRLNPDKTQVLRVGGPVDGGLGNSLMFGGVALAAKSRVPSLGIHLDLMLTMEMQVALVVRTAFFHLWRIARLRPYLDMGALTTLVLALVISRLDYCNTLYVGLPLKLMRKLQVVQNANAAARLLTGVRKYQHISPTLAMLHWLPIRFRIDFKVLMLTYKALNSLGPRYLAERLLPTSSTHVTHTSQEVRLRSLTLREARKERTRNRAFSAVAPRLWNNLPPESRTAPSLGTFKNQLKTWMYRQAFPSS